MEKSDSKSKIKKEKSKTKIELKDKKTVVDDKEGLVQPIEVAELSNAALVWEITKQLGGSVSGDMLNSGISLPAQMNEPLSILQRGAEVFEYCGILDKACQHKAAVNRLAFLAGFSVAPFSVTPDRFRTNFNPVLGETFQYVDNRHDSPVKIFCEQVSHHPHLAAMHAENDNWMFYQNYGATAEYLGNSLEIVTDAKTYLNLKKSDETYFAKNPRARVHNIILGTMWIEHHGDVDITNLKTGDRCIVTFEKAGFFDDKANTRVKGYITNKEGKKIIKLSGTWDDHLNALWLEDTEDYPKGHKLQVWKTFGENYGEQAYKFTKYAMTFNYMSEQMAKHYLPTDSRRRLDRFYLQNGDVEKATQWKRVAEFQQREDEKIRKHKFEQLEKAMDKEQRVADEKKKEKNPYAKNYWDPVWFDLTQDHIGQPFFSFNNKFNQLKDDDMFVSEQVKQTACDFEAYERTFGHLLDTTGKSSGKIVVEKRT